MARAYGEVDAGADRFAAIHMPSALPRSIYY